MHGARSKAPCDGWDGGRGPLHALPADGALDARHIPVGPKLRGDRVFERGLTRTLEAARREVPLPSTLLLFMLAAAREFVGDVAGAVAMYEELLAASPDEPEALDRVAHLHFRLNDVGIAIERCKRAHHLGVSTVFAAWTAGYYAKRKRRAHLARPTWARDIPDERLRIVEVPEHRSAS